MIARLVRSSCALAVTVLAGCGYQSAHAPAVNAPGWCVEPGPDPATHPQAASSLVFGARDVLARSGHLVACSEGRTFVVQIVDVSFEPAGVVSGDRVTARATLVRVTAAASVEGGVDVGTVVEEAVVATGTTPLSEQHAHGAGVAQASRRAGDALARRLLGEPVPTTPP